MEKSDAYPFNTSSAERGYRPPPVSSINQIEQITRREALNHVNEAWKAQQRLLRRCLYLKIGPLVSEKDTEQMDSCFDVNYDQDAKQDLEATEVIDDNTQQECKEGAESVVFESNAAAESSHSNQLRKQRQLSGVLSPPSDNSENEESTCKGIDSPGQDYEAGTTKTSPLDKDTDQMQSEETRQNSVSTSKSNHMTCMPAGPLFQGVELVTGMKILVKWLGDELKEAIIVNSKMENGKKTLVYLLFADEKDETKQPICGCSVNRIVKIISNSVESLELDHRNSHSDGSMNKANVNDEDIPLVERVCKRTSSVDASDIKVTESIEITSSISNDEHNKPKEHGRNKRRRHTAAELSTRNIIMQHFMKLQNNKR
ncbi:hypothetical protein ACHAXN_003698 [Cyclotella atomus]|jgi:hypothetical protein